MQSPVLREAQHASRAARRDTAHAQTYLQVGPRTRNTPFRSLRSRSSCPRTSQRPLRRQRNSSPLEALKHIRHAQFSPHLPRRFSVVVTNVLVLLLELVTIKVCHLRGEFAVAGQRESESDLRTAQTPLEDCQQTQRGKTRWRGNHVSAHTAP